MIHFSRPIDPDGPYPAILAACGARYDFLFPKVAAADLHSAIMHHDLIIMGGGGDIHPESIGMNTSLSPLARRVDKEIDLYEMAVLNQCEAIGAAVLGICRGAQLMNGYFGGSIIQDLPSEHIGSVIHGSGAESDKFLFHKVSVREGTILYKLTNTETIQVNTRHHQAVGKLGRGVKISAASADDVIEAIEVWVSQKPWLGFQWHPEFDRSALPLDQVLNFLTVSGYFRY